MTIINSNQLPWNKKYNMSPQLNKLIDHGRKHIL